MDNENKELAKKYIENQLNEEQLKSVAKKVKEDTAFADELAFQMALKEAGNRQQEAASVASDIQDVMNILSEDEIVENEPTATLKETPIRQIPYWKYAIGIAASSLLLFGVWWMNRPTPRAQVADAFLTETSANAEPQNLLGSFDLGRALQNEEYPAIIEWARESRNALNDRCKNNVANYYLGTLSLYTNTTGAPNRETFDALECVNNNYRSTHPDITIHLARAYWYNQELDKAKIMMKLVESPLPEDLLELQKEVQ